MGYEGRTKSNIRTNIFCGVVILIITFMAHEVFAGEYTQRCAALRCSGLQGEAYISCFCEVAYPIDLVSQLELKTQLMDSPYFGYYNEAEDNTKIVCNCIDSYSLNHNRIVNCIIDQTDAYIELNNN